jgi:hypothetical protein
MRLFVLHQQVIFASSKQKMHKTKIMKKIILTALIAVSLVSSSFASDVNHVGREVISNFNNEFANASEVEWSTTSSYAVATFVEDNRRMQAFYNFDGELIGSSRAITLDNLPSFAKRAFARKYEGYTVKEAIKFFGKDETAYFISATGEKGSVVIKVAGGIITTVKKS